MKLIHGRHNVGDSNYHLQFTPKYRRKIFANRTVRELCRALFKQKASQLGVRLEAIEFGPDHVHVFLTNCQNYSEKDLAFHFKGFSSRYLRAKAWNEVKQMLWGKAFWSSGHFFESVGRVTSKSVKFYIEQQQKKHWKAKDYDYECEVKAKTRQQQTRIEDFAS